MQFAPLTILALLLPAISAQNPPVRVTWDNVYDVGSQPLTAVACSDGANGLLTKGYRTQGDLPRFPYLGGSATISYNSASCGACFSLYNPANQATVYITGVDHCAEGFNIAEAAMRALNNNVLGNVENVQWAQVDSSFCPQAH